MVLLMELLQNHLPKESRMAFISGYISNYKAGVNDHVASGMITSYVPSSGDIVVACSCPNADNSGTPAADNINVWLTYEDTSTNPFYPVSRWVFKVSDTTYTGDISFEIITGNTPSSSSPSPTSASPPPRFTHGSMSANQAAIVDLANGSNIIHKRSAGSLTEGADDESQRRNWITAEDALKSIEELAGRLAINQHTINMQ
jgi:hypothetical protein